MLVERRRLKTYLAFLIYVWIFCNHESTRQFVPDKTVMITELKNVLFLKNIVVTNFVYS